MLLRMENPKEVRNLIQKEVDINCKDIYGSSPLDEAALHVGQIFLYFFFLFCVQLFKSKLKHNTPWFFVSISISATTKSAIRFYSDPGSSTSIRYVASNAWGWPINKFNLYAFVVFGPVFLV